MKSKENSFSDFESKLLGELAAGLRPLYEAADVMWSGSPFAWIKTRPSRQIGAIGERLVSDWCESKSFEVERTGDSDADRLINGHRIEIKFSTLWSDNGIYKFQQIRDQDYEYCFCLGVSPFEVHAWFIPKSEISKPRPPALTHQHGGVDGRDTLWLSFPAGNPPSWLAPFGGSLDKVEKLIKSAG
jgi:hypothetical protein